LKIQALGFKIQDFDLKIQAYGFKIQDFDLKIQAYGFKILDFDVIPIILTEQNLSQTRSA